MIEHLEGHFGPIEVGWSKDADGVAMPFQVVRMPARSLEGHCAFATLGLGTHPLRSPLSGKLIRHELLFVAPRGFGDRSIPGLLQQVGLDALRRGQAYLRGDVIGPRGQLFQGSEMQAFYVAMPAYFPDSLATYKPPRGEEVVVAWLVPISMQEATYIRMKGWEAFEDALSRLDPDLANPLRHGMSLLD
jgi:hypothetical protein